MNLSTPTIFNQTVIFFSTELSIPKPDLRSSSEQAALEMVVDLMKQLNENNIQDYMETDSAALKHVQAEMNRVAGIIESFLETSLNLVDNEGICVYACEFETQG